MAKHSSAMRETCQLHSYLWFGLDLRKSRLELRDTSQNSGLEVVAVEHLEVVAVRVLATSTVAVVGVVLVREGVLGGPVKVGKAHDVGECGKAGGAAEDRLDAGIGRVEEGPGGHGPGNQGAGEDLSTHGE